MLKCLAILYFLTAFVEGGIPKGEIAKGAIPKIAKDHFGPDKVDMPKSEYIRFECLLTGSTYDQKNKTCNFKTYTKEECKAKGGADSWCTRNGSSLFKMTFTLIYCDWNQLFPGRCYFRRQKELQTPAAKYALDQIGVQYGEQLFNLLKKARSRRRRM